MNLSLSAIGLVAPADAEVADILHREVEAHPEWADIQNQWGLYLLTRRRYDEAVRAFRRALERNPNYAWASINLAVVRFCEGRTAEALAMLDAAPMPPGPAVPLTRGWMHQLLGEPVDLETIEEASERPDGLWLRTAVAEAAEDLTGERLWEQFQANPIVAEARSGVDELRVASRDGRAGLFPGLYQLWYAASRIQGRLGRFLEARSTARIGYIYHSDRGRYLNHLGFLAELEGDASESVRCYWEATRISPKDPTGPAALARHWSSQGDLDRAIRYLKTALERAPRYADLLRLMGHLEAARDRHAEALAFFRQALEINPRYQLARVDAANALFRTGSWEEAAPAFAGVIDDGIRSGDLYVHYGRALEHLDRPEEAVEAYRRALELNEDELLAHYRLSLALPAQGAVEEGDRHWARVEELAETIGTELIPDPELFENAERPLPVRRAS